MFAMIDCLTKTEYLNKLWKQDSLQFLPNQWRIGAKLFSSVEKFKHKTAIIKLKVLQLTSLLLYPNPLNPLISLSNRSIHIVYFINYAIYIPTLSLTDCCQLIYYWFSKCYMWNYLILNWIVPCCWLQCCFFKKLKFIPSKYDSI